MTHPPRPRRWAPHRRPRLGGLLGAGRRRPPGGAARRRRRSAARTSRSSGVPLNPWRPATKDAVDADAEGMDGDRARLQADAAAAPSSRSGGGHHPPRSRDGPSHEPGARLRPRRELSPTYEKLHLPEEPGFWETSHRAGHRCASTDRGIRRPVRGPGLLRHQPPEARRILAAAGALAVLAPRATEEATYQRWKAFPRHRADELLLRAVRQSPASGGRRAHRRAERRGRPERRLPGRDDRHARVVTIDAEVVRRSRDRLPGLPAGAGAAVRGRLAEIAGRDG